MIAIIMGQKGSGKTKALIDMVNDATEKETGTIIYVVKGDRHTFDVKTSVRLVDTSDYDLDSFSVFYGFICGIISRDYDVSHIFIDSATKIVNSGMDEFLSFLDRVEKTSEQFNIKFTITISYDTAKAPERIKKYLIEH